MEKNIADDVNEIHIRKHLGKNDVEINTNKELVRDHTNKMGIEKENDVYFNIFHMLVEINNNNHDGNQHNINGIIENNFYINEIESYFGFKKDSLIRIDNIFFELNSKKE